MLASVACGVDGETGELAWSSILSVERMIYCSYCGVVIGYHSLVSVTTMWLVFVVNGVISGPGGSSASVAGKQCGSNAVA